ncbi:MAG: type ISP restriction/modification enzyme, partial [Gammaproteobacteria bacterium]
ATCWWWISTGRAQARPSARASTCKASYERKVAWDYVVNGKAALDWVMERQAVRTDKASGIVNDANDWATETMGNPKYPLELFQRVVTVSLETQKIVKGLPKLDIGTDD